MTTILLLSDHPTLFFAAEELKRTLERMDSACVVSIATGDGAGLRLGLMADFGLRVEATDPLVDEIWIGVDKGNGIIAGANPRSVLIAVYRFLTELGCRWVRPGTEGEYIPRVGQGGISAEEGCVSIRESPSYRHRAVCIEGATSLENTLDMVDWLPKVGLSGFFMQFREGFTFFDRWYRHVNNPLLAPEPFSVEQAREFTACIEAELQKRGLVYHAIGHGWTCEGYGISCLGWDMETGREWPPEFLADVAEVNGKRSVPWDIVSIAALCYSKPEVQHRLANTVVTYAASHPQIDLVHVWLDDGFNNKCECAGCTRRPADYYIEILNRIDLGLTSRGLQHKIVFLAYVDMLWPPETARLANPDRFVFMFAPISRDYRQPMLACSDLPGLPPFERNHLRFPSDIAELLSFLKAWQEVLPIDRPIDSFVFDYHLWTGPFNLDPGYMRLSKTINEDMAELYELGLDGMVSCQLMRVYFPTSLPMVSMARTLWDRSVSYNAVARNYFEAAYGPSGDCCQDYLEELASLIDYSWLRGVSVAEAADVRAKLIKAEERIGVFMPVIRAEMETAEPAWAFSWRTLEAHAEVNRLWIACMLAQLDGDHNARAGLWEQIKAYVQGKEMELQSVLDVWAYVNGFEKTFKEALIT
jgi:hypothetical protein